MIVREVAMSAPQTTTLFVIFWGYDPRTGEVFYGMQTDAQNREVFAVKGQLRKDFSLSDDIHVMLQTDPEWYDFFYHCEFLHSDNGADRWKTPHFASAQVDISLWRAGEEHGLILPKIRFLPISSVRKLRQELMKQCALPSSFVTAWELIQKYPINITT